MVLPEYPTGIQSSEKVQAALNEAIRSLSSLESVIQADVLPNVDILTELLPLQESRLSCSVENIVTTQDDVFRVFSIGEGPSDANVRDVLGYHRSISSAWGKDITIGLLESICSMLKMDDMEIRSSSEDTVYLQDGNGEIVYEPLSGEEVPDALGRLFAYLDESKYDPIIRMIIIHAFFEMIHPFKDGNGRTGRILNEVILHRFGLLSRPVLCLSRFLVEHRRDYYRFLRMVERGESWEKYVLFMLEGVKECADRSLSLVKELNMSLRDAYVFCGSAGFSRDVVDLLYSHPYIRAVHLVDAGLVSRNTASKYLSELESMGVLIGEQAGKGKIYRNKELMRIMNEKK